MKKYETFILNEELRSDTKKLNLYEIKKIIKENCKEFDYYNDKLIYRSLNNVYEFYLEIDPKKYERKSLTKDNSYNIIIDETWKNYPKRENSLIASTNQYYTDQFGNSTFIVIPFDGSKWVLSPIYDLWFSFKNLLKIFHVKTIKDFFRIIINIYQDFFNIKYKITDYNSIKNMFNEIQKYIKENKTKLLHTYKERYGQTYQKLFFAFLKDDNFFDWLVDEMKPDKNGFKLLDYKDLQKEFPKNMRELWTDSKCLLIFVPENNEKEILNKIFKTKYIVEVDTDNPEFKDFISENSPISIEAFDEDEIKKLVEKGDNKTGIYVKSIKKEND